MIWEKTHLLVLLFLTLSLFSCTDEQDSEVEETSVQHELPADGIKIVDAWVRPGQANGVTALYMTILNGSSEADTLISISSDVARVTEVHESYELEDGMKGMRKAETVIAPAKGFQSLKPGGLHVMLMRLNQGLTEGNQVEFTLEFSNSGEITASAPVQAMQP